MSAAEVLRQAEELKEAVADTTRSANEVWVSRQALQDSYQKLLVIDLEFALDKKVEQDLWNHAFKKQISTLQNQAKDKQNQKRGEVQSSLNLFLETASGFYLQLLQVICSAFNLDLPFRKKSSHYGIMREFGPVMTKIKTPKRSSCMYICQDCLVHLGDIARYRQQIDQAQSYYRHAAHLVPYNGQPYNQLAILEAAKGNKLSTVFFHIRSIAVKHPFPVAMTNLEKFYAKISKDIHDYRAKLTANELIGIFLQLHAFVFLCIDLTKAKSHADRFLANLPTHITSNTFSAHQLVQMVAVNLFSLYHSKRKHYSSSGQPGMKNGGDKNGNSEALADSRKPKEKGGGNQRTSFDLLFEITLSMFEVLLQSTPKDESKAKECHTLAPIKVLLDWLHTDPDTMSNPAFKTSSVWMNLSELLNNLQFFINQSEFMNDLQKHMSTPLPEDCDLECFLPVSKAHSDLTYYSTSTETMTEEMEMRLRCHKLVMSGFWIAEKFPSLNLLNVQQLANGHLEFSTQIKPMQGNNGDHKATRQNVAIQAIMQKGNKETVDKKRDNAMNQSSRTGSCSRTTATEAKDLPEKFDAGVMAHARSGVGDGERLSEKSFGSWSSMERLTNSSHGTAAGSPGSSHSVSTETSYSREFQPGSMPSIGVAASQQPPQQVYPYYLTQQGTSPMFVRSPSSEAQMMPPIPSSTALVQQQQGGIIGQRMMSPSERENLLNNQQNGIGFTGPGKDAQSGHFDQLAALYSPGIRGFGPREPLAPPPPQGQAFFRIGQPYSYGTMPPPPRNVMPMYMARQEDPSSRGMPLPMGMMPLQWARQPVVPPRMPFVPYPSLNEPPPKLSQTLPCDEFPPAGVRGSQLGYSQTSPGGLAQDPGVLDGMSHQSMQSANHDGYLFTPGVGAARFPTARSHLQSVLMNGGDHVPGIPFSGLSYGEIEANLDQPHGTRPRFMAQQGPRMYMGNGVHMSDILDNIPASGPSQPLGMFQAEKRILNELDMMQQNADMKSNPDKVLSYPASSGIGMNSFSCRTGDILKADSPQPIGARSQSSIFMTAANAKREQPPASNTYTLFSQTPWTVGIAKSTDGNSHASSTFGSSNSSLRTTPDPDERSSVSSGGGYRVGLFNRPSTAASNDGPWNTPSVANNSTAAAAGGGALLNNSLQSLWNSGLSPLEKLLEQQRQQRQCEPR